MSSLKTPLLIVLFIFLSLFVYTKLAGPIPFTVNSVTTTKDSLFRVDGTGEATAVPNTAQVSLGVTKQATTVTDAQNQVNTVSNNLIAEIKKLGIEEKDIKTTNYSVNPNYDYSNGRQGVNGYIVTQTLDVKIKEIEKANQVVDAGTKAGANIVNGVQFVLDDETKDKLLEEARKEAVEEAKKKAESLADLAGIRLGRVVDIQEASNKAEIMPYAMNAQDSRGSAGGETQITPGESTVNVTITLSYETF